MTRVKAMIGRLEKSLEAKGQSQVSRAVILKEHAGLLDCLTLLREATADTIEAVRAGVGNGVGGWGWGWGWIQRRIPALSWGQEVSPLVGNPPLRGLTCVPAYLS